MRDILQVLQWATDLLPDNAPLTVAPSLANSASGDRLAEARQSKLEKRELAAVTPAFPLDWIPGPRRGTLFLVQKPD
jgi:hypothetical protein